MPDRAPNRAPGTVWGMRRGFNDGYVRTDVGDTIEIVMPWPGDRTKMDHMFITRTDAALLAKRIQQCLKHTAKR